MEAPPRPANTIFILSPANCSGRRAGTLFQPATMFDLAARIRTAPGAPLGEVFSFLSGLYFRGKLRYAERFGGSQSEPGGVEPLVITAGCGLMPASTRVTIEDLRGFAAVSVGPGNPAYQKPLEKDLRRLNADLPDDTRVVFLGSIATPKYLDPLLSILGDRLCFPVDFIGRGDMSRGSILLRAAAAGREVEYVGARGAPRSLAAQLRAGGSR